VLHPQPTAVIEIGVGTGIQFAPVLSDERVKAAHLVEISPAVVNAAAFFSKENRHLLTHPKVSLRVDDGRHDLRVRPARYDLIILGLFIPYAKGAGSLFSREFYALCRQRLKAGGMVVHWLPLHQLTPEGLRSAITTFRSVFPHLSVWERDQYVALVGHPNEVSVDVRRASEVLRSPSLASTVEPCGLGEPTAFFASFLMGPEEAAAFAGGAPLNTDDHARIEFSRLNLARAHFYDLAAEHLEALLRVRASPVRVLHTLEGSDLARLERGWTAHGDALRGAIEQVRGHHQAAYELFRRAAALNPNEPIARSELPKYEK
jgi:spermidine synthase